MFTSIMQVLLYSETDEKWIKLCGILQQGVWQEDYRYGPTTACHSTTEQSGIYNGGIMYVDSK